MHSRPLGQTGVTVSEIALGTWAFGGDEWGTSDDRQAIATIRTALDAGVTLIDTADVYGYGHSEELVGMALPGAPAEVLVCSKAGNDIYETPPQPGGGPKRFSATYLARALDGSLARLGRDAVDIYLLHNPSLDVLAADEAMSALRAARAAGKARLIGASVYTAAEGRAAIDTGGAEVVMITYNLLNHEEAQQLAAYAHGRGVAVLARSTLANGLLTGKYDAGATFTEDDHRAHRGAEWLPAAMAKVDSLRPLAGDALPTLRELALAYVLGDPRVASVLVGARSPAQLAENLATAAFAPLDRELSERIAAVQGRW